MSCSSPDPPAFCSDASPELKLYQAFIFSVPVFFTFILLLLFYLFYLRRRRANWASIRMRISYQARGELPRSLEHGIKKELREMLPVVVFKESFLIRETQCSVCLGDYKSDDRLKRIPPCGHTFHVDCIDHWLSTNITCPLCRASLIPTPRAATEPTSLGTPSDDLEDQVSVALPVEQASIEREEEGSRDIWYDEGVEVRDRLSSDDSVCARADEDCVCDGEVQSVTEDETNGAGESPV